MSSKQISITEINHLKELYETNYITWLEETIKLLKTCQLDKLDYENLIEELEDLSKREKRRLRSLLEQIIRHLLMAQYWESERTNNYYHWLAEIVSFRNQLNEDLTTNLYQYLQGNLPIIYSHAVDYVKLKANLTTLPDTCPYTLENLIDKNWLPK
ncbi:DUF29 domain-containing protein [Crocosphaera sp. XPORK-15E]|uniref:DUF29 domain-containing protein n=1 Tax=Crocosphaera sp. XPORK-15E TaxID=3110247 RepID=UPI002B1F811E|nr:DUF29 domain-containing protein [Crocosphaera sp. XPORK-15E]MEA5533915.1 DUF29 domain-containing protein [Crocosphaera sp. XPORK-15E]